MHGGGGGRPFYLFSVCDALIHLIDAFCFQLQ